MDEALNFSIPEWTRDDFLDAKPFEWLYQHKDNQFQLKMLVSRTKELAKSLKIAEFTKLWETYVQEQNTAVSCAENFTIFPEQPMQLNSGVYICNEYGVARESAFGQLVEVISHPLMPTARNIDISTGTHYFDLSFYRGNEARWQTIKNVPQEVLSNAIKIVSLSSRGPAITSSNSKEVVSFLSDVISRNYNEIPCGRITSRLGWTDDGFLPYINSIAYDQNGSFENEYQAVRCEGSFEKWKNVVSALRKPTTLNAPLRIYLAASFASVLAGKLGILPCIILLIAPSGAGKTVAMQLASSVWADPKAWLHSLLSTTTANELLAGFCHDLPLMMDELQTIAETKNGRNSLQTTIYNLAEGTGKGRGNKDGGLRKRQRWNCFTFMTGEQSVNDDRSHEGAIQRVIELRARAGFLAHPSEISSFAKANYGWAGRAFVEHLMTLNQEQWKQLKKEHSGLSDELQEQGVASKQADSAAAIILADRLAEEIIFGDGYTLTVNDVLPYLKSNREIDINRRCYEYILGWLDENESHFIRNHDTPKSVIYGKILSPSSGTPEQYHILQKSLNAELAEAGFDRPAFIEWAKERGIIKAEKSSPADGTVIRDRQRVYNFFRISLEDEKDDDTTTT